MALMPSKLYDALLEAGTSETKAREAAEEAAAYEQRFLMNGWYHRTWATKPIMPSTLL
jgi:hypothetical protein